MSVNFGTTPIRPATLLGRLEKYLQGYGLLTADAIFLSVVPDEFHIRFPPCDQFLVIFPPRFPVWQSVVSGTGAEQTGFDVSVQISILTRLSTDQEFRSSNVITNLSQGMLGLVGRMMGAVQFWTAPTDDDVNVSYLREPMRISPGFDIMPREYQKSLWSIARSTWEMKFTADLT